MNGSETGLPWSAAQPERCGGKHAHTMVELLVALALAGIAVGFIYLAFASQQKAHVLQVQTAELQQNLRAALDIMVQEIRMAGYDPTAAGLFGFKNLPAPGPSSYGRHTAGDGICFYADANGNGLVDGVDSEQVAFRLNVDQRGNALTDADQDHMLRKFSCSAVPWEMLAENIVALGFAYTREGVSGWAIDSSSPPDGYLDLNLDTNHDGEVDAADDPAGEPLATPIPVGAVNSVKIWLLGRSQTAGKDHKDTRTYAIANQRITPNNGYVHRVVTATVHCRNTRP